MYFRLLSKAIYFNDSNMLKRCYSLCLIETKQFYISSRKCVNLSTFNEYKNCHDFQDVKYDKFKIYKAMREIMVATGKYDTLTSLTIIHHELDDLKLINKIKSEKWTLFPSSECLEKFSILSSYAVKSCQDLSNDDYNHVVSTLTSKVCRFSDDELLTLLRYLEVWPNIYEIRTSSVRNLLKEIDNELIKRSKFWPNKKIMLYCDIIYQLFNFYSGFISISLKKLTLKCSMLSSTDIVRIMYFLFIYSLPKYEVDKLESSIQHYFDSFEIPELQIICLGFFMTEVKIYNKVLFQQFLKKVINNVNDFSDNNLSAFLKVFRYSFDNQSDFLELYEELFGCLVPIVPRVSILVLTQMSHLMAKSLIYNSFLMSAIIQRFLECLNTARIKDIERVLLLFATFNYPPHEPVYRLIIEELRNPRRREEKKKFPKEYGYALRQLVQVNIYPMDLISFVMGPEYKKLAYGKDPLKVGIENFILDQSLRIEYPYYKGPQLNNDICKYMSNKFTSEPNSLAIRAKQEIIKLLHEIYPMQNVALSCKILPHFKQENIILCIDHDNNAIQTPKLINNGIKWIPMELKRKYNWIAFLFAPEAVIIRNTKQFNGSFCANLRQLEKVGYIPIVVPYFEWIYNKKKKEYLEKKILNCINLQKKINW